MSQGIENYDGTINDHKVNLDKYLQILLGNFTSMTVDERFEFEKNLSTTCKHISSILPLPSLENELFSKLLPKIENASTKIIRKITPTAHKAICSKEITESFLQDLIALVKCIGICYDSINPVTSVDLDYVYTLPKTSLSVSFKLFNFYEECQGFVEYKVSNDLLSALFNQATALTKNFISLWERVKIIISFKDHADAVVTVCSYLNKICKSFENIAGKSPVALWKINVSTLVKHCVAIKDQVDVAEPINILCLQIEKRLNTLMTLCTNNLPFQEKRTDILQIIQQCGFNLKIIVNLVEKFQFYLGDCFNNLLNLILCLYGVSSSSLTSIAVPDLLKSDFERNVSLVIEPLILLLLNEPEFIYLLTFKRFDINEPNRTPYSWIMLYIFIFENFHKISEIGQDKLFLKTSTARSACGNILEEFFNVFSKCFIEIGLPALLPGVMCQGKPQVYVSFYQFCCTRFSSFIAGIPAQHFKYLEDVLIDNLLNEDIWKSILACDLLIFLGRLESAELCFKHCCLLADLTVLLEANNFKIGFGLSLALKRLFNILATEHKVLYYRKYHPTKKPEIWICIGFKALSSEYSSALHDDLDRLAVGLRENLKIILENDFEKLNCQKSVDDLIKSVVLLRELTQLPNFSDKNLTNLCLRLWQHLPVDFVNKNEIANSLVSHLIQWICLLVSDIPNNLFLEILIIMARLQQDCKSTVVLYGILQFLRAISSKNISNSKEKDAILKQIACLLSNCVQEENIILFHIGLETFVHFSQSTPHEIIITESLFQKPQLQNNITKFLNRIPFFRSENLQSNSKELLSAQIYACQDIAISKKCEAKAISKESENVSKKTEVIHETKEISEELSDDLKQTFIEVESGISKLSQLILHSNSNPKLIESHVHLMQLQLKNILESNLVK